MTSIRLAVFASVMAAVASLVIAGSARAQTANPFGTREPRVCSPITSKPSPEQAAQLVQCQFETKTERDMVLLEDVRVQMGRGQPYNYDTHSRLTGIDTTAEVFPIRGSYVSFDCSRIAVIPVIKSDNRGKNCFSVSKPTASGYCWATTFGDWQCTMIDTSHNDVVEDQPPPQD